MHIRYVAYILNLIVHDGLKDVSNSVKKVRDVVRYIRNSPMRLRKFKEYAELVGIESNACINLDVPTRWNSTYLMLKTACIYEKVFEKYDENESAFKADLGDGVPDIFDWHYVNKMVEYLEHFYEMTLRISGSKYVTSNTFFNEIADLQCVLHEWKQADDDSLISMGLNMKAKFDKYWGDPDKMNFIIFFANILDPTHKLEYLEFSLLQMHGQQIGSTLYSLVKSSLFELFDDYKAMYTSTTESGSDIQIQSATHVDIAHSSPDIISGSFGRQLSVLKAKFKKHKLESGLGGSKQSELEMYLSEAVIEDDGSCDVLRWWKFNSQRFPILSHLVRDVLAVPILIVASELAFSTGGRVLDVFRSSLTPKVVKALICTQD